MIKNENKRIAITLTDIEFKNLEKIANKMGVSKSIIIKLALDKYLISQKNK